MKLQHKYIFGFGTYNNQTTLWINDEKYWNTNKCLIDTYHEIDISTFYKLSVIYDFDNIEDNIYIIINNNEKQLSKKLIELGMTPNTEFQNFINKYKQ